MRIIGHRGARGEAPENTLGGFHYLHHLGVRAVEFDVRQLKDDQLVVIHDDNFVRTTGQLQHVESCTLAQAQQFDHRHHWQAWAEPEYTPSLEQVMACLTDFEHIEVEIKAVADEVAAERLIVQLHQDLKGFEQTATITSFDVKILAALQQYQSHFKRGLLVEIPIGEYAIEFAHQYGCNQIGWKDQLATDEMIQRTQQADLEISVWTVNEIERAKHLQQLGVQGLITDVPTTMLQHLSL
ncbi:glycerophosphodiester phosphodiesterase [Acinetobacter sp. NIPH 2699]|uniref:glycerophosphodiester phosphodiesterase n=1 Tax=Acinetobacter sp. NIPH 2699 TaxID=2923433 RepID=UPI001F4A9F57|nr:glycerophosphodiester phosphodiesterase [Acinetobacter sp. NIPH 2699]MCH7336520.1 glycerophosphodiester phosphodiesterase [Acinetobacter sp. NIPH 2699]